MNGWCHDNLQDVPNLSMKHLRAVVALARFGSFVAAASYLQISQPGLSRMIQQAEVILGVKLFTRGTRSVAQTEAGRGFIPMAERLLGELLQQSLKIRSGDSEMRGQLIISSLMSISHHVLPSALVAFRKKHSKMYVQIREGLASAVQEDVRSGIADFGQRGRPNRGHRDRLCGARSLLRGHAEAAPPRKAGFCQSAGHRRRADDFDADRFGAAPNARHNGE